MHAHPGHTHAMISTKARVDLHEHNRENKDFHSNIHFAQTDSQQMKTNESSVAGIRMQEVARDY